MAKPHSHPSWDGRSPNQTCTPEIVWKGKEYPRIEPGIREVRVHKIQGPEFVRNYRRWSLRVECHTTDEPGEVSAFFNLGNDPERPSMGKGRQSRIYKLFVLANGGAPRTGQKIDFGILLGKFFRVRVEQSTHDSKGQPKAEADVYSRITEFLELTGP